MDPTTSGVIASLVAAAIAGTVGYSWRTVRSTAKARKLARRFHIAGTYKSVYTDVLGGTERRIRDAVHLSQSGTQVTGFSENLDSGRKFDLTGELLDARYLTGRYKGRTSADSGMGVFFMKLDALEHGLLEGLWAGFGAEAGDLIGGRWEWRRLETVTIAQVDVADSHEVTKAVALVNAYIGTGYLSVDGVVRRLKHGDGFVVVARHDGEIVGAATCDVLRQKEISGLRNTILRARGKYVDGLHDQRVGMLRSAAVMPRSRRRGVGLQLVRERLAILAREGCTVVYTFAWDSGEVESSNGVLEAAGFRPVVTIPKYWHQAPEGATFTCAKCGQPCTCSAVVMRRSLVDWPGSTTGEPLAA